jgi:hypothetical protein
MRNYISKVMQLHPTLSESDTLRSPSRTRRCTLTNFAHRGPASPFDTSTMCYIFNYTKTIWSNIFGSCYYLREFAVDRALHRALIALGGSPVEDTTSQTRYIRVLTSRGSAISTTYSLSATPSMSRLAASTISGCAHLIDCVIYIDHAGQASCDYFNCVRSKYLLLHHITRHSEFTFTSVHHITRHSGLRHYIITAGTPNIRGCAITWLPKRSLATASTPIGSTGYYEVKLSR